MQPFSDYIVYVDESGDHALITCDPDYPVFVLAFCIMNKQTYSESIVPSVQALKFRHFGHDMIVLHEHEIRKATGDFAFLTNRTRREEFMGDLSRLVEQSPFVVVGIAIDKQRLQQQYADPSNPYHIAMQFGLERIDEFLQRENQHDKVTHFVFESRGRKEDNELELAFRRVCSGQNYGRKQFTFEIVLADKKTNSCGLQLADMIARPIGRKIIRPEQENRAYSVIERKLRKSPSGSTDGWGLKVFP